MNITAQNISKSYGNHVVLDDVSLSIQKGEIVGLLGRNGVGKSTLLKIIAGINLPDAGSVDLRGEGVGYLSERNPLYPFMYVREYLTWVGSVKGLVDINQKVDQAIQNVGLEEALGKKVRQLSKGFRQRLGLAATLLPDPLVIILDEPISGLDPIQVEEYRLLIRTIAKDKIIILSSHLLQEIESLCDRVILLKDGHIADDRLINQVDTIYITLVLDKQIELEKFEFINEIMNIDFVGANTYKITTHGDVDIRLQIFDTVVDAGCRIVELSSANTSLNELFK